MLHGPGFGRLYISMGVLSQYFSLRKIDRIKKQPGTHLFTGSHRNFAA